MEDSSRDVRVKNITGCTVRIRYREKPPEEYVWKVNDCEINTA